MIKLMIPGFGPLEIVRVVTDYTGTHSFKGGVRKSVRTRLAQLAKLLEVQVLTVDTFGPHAANSRGCPSNCTF